MGGIDAQALHDNSFVRNATNSTFTTTKPWSFIINVPFSLRNPSMWWVGINTNAPAAELDVNGDIIWRWTLVSNWKITANVGIDVMSGKVSTPSVYLYNDYTVVSAASCSYPGTMVFNGSHFFWCTSAGVRKQLDN